MLNSQQQHTDAEWDELETELNVHFDASWKTLLNRQVEQAPADPCQALRRRISSWSKTAGAGGIENSVNGYGAGEAIELTGEK